MNAILNKVFPEGYRKLVATIIVMAIGLAIYQANGRIPDEVVKLLLGGLGIFTGGNVAEWIARAVGDLDKPGGFVAARNEVVGAVKNEAANAVGTVAPPNLVAGIRDGLGAAVGALQNGRSALAGRIGALENAVNQVLDSQAKQGNAIGGIVQLINGNRRAASAASPMAAGASPLNEQES